MRRKSERTAGKKTKSPEKKLEKVKRTRTRRRKQSTSSDNESADETSPVKVVESVSEVEKKPPTTPTKEPSPEEAQDQVWRVKTSEGSGEIQKLKICLTRPPSTPERADRSPRSKRKHSRATSSSDTPSNEGDDKKKSKHRSKRSTRESKDNPDSQEEHEAETESHHSKDKSDNEISQSSDKVSDAVPDDTPMSTTNEEAKPTHNVDQSHDSTSKEEPPQKEKTQTQDTEQSKTSDADTTVASPKVETTVVSSETETTVVSTETETNDDNATKSDHSADQSKDIAEDKSEVLELHAEDNRCDTLDTDVKKKNKHSSNQKTKPNDQDQDEKTSKDEVSKTEDKTEKTSKGNTPCDSNEGNKSSGDTHVVEKAEKQPKEVVESSELKNNAEEPGEKNEKELERSDSTHSQQEENAQNGSAAPIIISRKRRWGSRATKIQTQKSITISTDILKDIIPDVKPVEFDEVIEDKKSKREVTEKIERPVLPKIVIDNTESIEINKKVSEERDRENVKPRDSHLTSNRKISIVKENNSIIARPPSPPRHKPSCILFITNLVRPFTLPQLKNLLQRTGRIVEDGFWIDRIKSKCYVKYETEDQAVETRHALHGVTWPVSNPKTLQVDFSTVEAFEKAKLNEDTDNAQASTIPGTVEDWLREQDMKRERGEIVNDKPYERKAVMREWDVGKNDKDKEKDKLRRLDERLLEKRRHRTPERSPEPARKFKKKEEEAPAKLLDDLFKKTKTTPCIYWLPLSAETVNIAVKEEQRRAHMAEHERRLQELRRTHRRH